MKRQKPKKKRPLTREEILKLYQHNPSLQDTWRRVLCGIPLD